MSTIINISHLFNDEGPKTPDVVKFRVVWREDEEMESREFETFASAAGFAGALHERIKSLVMLTADINESHYGTLYHYKNNERRKANKGFIAVVKAALENR